MKLWDLFTVPLFDGACMEEPKYSKKEQRLRKKAAKKIKQSILGKKKTKGGANAQNDG